MTDDPKNHPTNDAPNKDLTRRDFTVLVVGAGLAATVPLAAAADLQAIGVGPHIQRHFHISHFEIGEAAEIVD